MHNPIPKALNIGDIFWLGFLIAFCMGFCYYFSEDWVAVGYLLCGCFLYSGWVHTFSQGGVLRFYNAYEVGPAGTDRHRNLCEFARELSSEAGIINPKVFVYESAIPNAFSLGRSRRSASIAVASCLFDLSDKRELRAVVSHELAHIINRDSLSTSICHAFGNLINVQLRIVRPIFWFLISRKHWLPRLLGFVITGLLLVLMIASQFVEVLTNQISKRREYRADMTGSSISRDPLSLASALDKMEKATIALYKELEVIPDGTRKIHTVNPAFDRSYSDLNVFEKMYYQLKSTHPPAEKRIERLLSLKKDEEFFSNNDP